MNDLYLSTGERMAARDNEFNSNNSIDSGLRNKAYDEDYKPDTLAEMRYLRDIRDGFYD